MIVTLIWVIAFAVILLLCLKRWETSVSGAVGKLLPDILRSEDDRWVWSPAIAVLGATAIVRPVDMILTLLIIGLLVLIGGKLVCWAMSKIDFH
ncbi:hypothetical protein FZZ93_06160 [Halomonas eurihalina]|uniref:Uncharacterized protein n=1 Tax=Halomonas eurihalina TaxID=42566 RepID=A0A5D9D9R1_HALER|nr:hypothetical protein [Halomonas eurihalina]MDR5859333.1 hypothetical protein [Halomonas eurihalina]TZG40624.1 hypothetical protein FZZ93_06160 [Halomonas eurihalina]